jgi:hypothetical protein
VPVATSHFAHAHAHAHDHDHDHDHDYAVASWDCLPPLFFWGTYATLGGYTAACSAFMYVA